MVQCPGCGESEDLQGSRQGDSIRVTCNVCGESWERSVDKPKQKVSRSAEKREQALIAKATAKRSRRSVLVKTPSGRLMKGTERCVGTTKAPCSHCQQRAASLKWEISFPANEGVGGSKDRYCMKCRSELVIDFDEELYAQHGQPPGPKQKRQHIGAQKWRPEPDWAAIAETEIGPNWRDA